MSSQVAPWLEDLDEDWLDPPSLSNHSTDHQSAIAAVLNQTSSASRIPRRSSGQFDINTSSIKQRNPLRDLPSSQSNAQRQSSTSSVVHHDSVKRSPAKHQTLEWKKRLVRGEVGYGDQTDLFGPSGLENIFSPARPTSSNNRPTSSNSPSRLLQNTFMPPSSPPPWPSQIDPSQLDSPDAQGTCQRQVNNTDYTDPQDDSLMRSVNSPSQLHIDRSASKHQGNRTISANTDLSGEGFSPVFLSKHTSSTGAVSYAPLDSRSAPVSADASINGLDSELPSTPGFRKDNSDALDNMPSVPEVSLPDDLPTGTPPITSFVTLNRLSPSSPTKVEPSSVYDQDSSISPGNSSPVREPATPKLGHIEESSLLSPPKSRPSQSPLKLFTGNYDTFTNNKLFRRMSQLEGLDPDHPLISAVHPCDDPFDDTRSTSGRVTSSGTVNTQRLRHSHRAASNLSSFGEGNLDEHDFDANISIPTGLDLDATFESTEGSPLPEAVPPGSTHPFRFHVETAPPVELSPEVRPFKLKRKLSKRSNTIQSRHSDDEQALEQFPVIDPYNNEFDIRDGKRPQSSPAKAPTAKRRRTLITMDGKLPELGEGSEIHIKVDAPIVNIEHGPAVRDFGTGSVESRRDVTRPRNPTPSQRRREQIQAEISEATFEYLSKSPRLEAIKETIEELSELGPESVDAEKAKAVAADIAAFTFDLSKKESRKRSYTTQDFLDEAMHIMSIIRARGRPHSGLDDVEESSGEMQFNNTHLHPDDLARQVGSLRVSRSAASDGNESNWRPRSQVKHDPMVASRLEQFRERDNLDIVDASLRSLNIDDTSALDFDHEDVPTRELDDASVIEPGWTHGHTRAYSNTSQHGAQPSPTKSQHGSHPSLDSSSGARTMGSTSSRDCVANLSPDKVAHLIPEQIAGMTYDKEKQIWVKARHLRPPTFDYYHQPSNVSSEDDPFAYIPDLTVDEINEIQRIQHMQERRQGLAQQEQSEYDISGQHTELPQQVPDRPPPQRQEATGSRPTTRDSNVPHPFTSSTAPSKYSGFASSQQQQQFDTRATSWSNEELANIARAKQQQAHSGDGLRDLATVNIPQNISEETEIVLDESIVSQDQSQLSHVSHEDSLLDELLSEDEELLNEDSITEELPAPKQRGSGIPLPSWSLHDHQPARRGGMKNSLRRQTFQRGFPSGQDQREVSFVATFPDKRTMSVSVVTQPAPTMAAPNQEYGLSSPARMDGTFYLSDLPDFTVNDVDEERPSEKALARRVARVNSGDRYAMAVQSLVKTLTDVEPDEPYWEDIKQLNLRGRGLDSVHNLEDFCTRLEDLDLSSNNVAHLEGAPTSVRRLNLRSNALSSLTAWSHMMNLQYLDISNNQVDNLSGLSILVHLRELRADDNQISNLDGIMNMDGLLKLSVRRNQLSKVDFEGCQLTRLEELDLSSNKLSRVSGIQRLSSLERLILDDNKLEHFSTGHDGCANSRLHCLSLQKNKMAILDVSTYTNLRYLNVDENRMLTVQGVDQLHHIDILSMRKQDLKHAKAQQLTIFNQRLSARSLFLSSNIIPSLDLPNSYHSIQNLEMASCGLQELPNDFGLKFSNLRTLNMSFNAITDIRPLLNITRLEKLFVSGNRIARLRKTVAVLARMPHLRKTDLRDNPVTHGFYTPISVAKNSVSTVADDEEPLSEAQLQLQIAMSHCLPNADHATDTEHLARLDEDTKLRRRVYEILLSNGCKTLSTLDGLSFAKDRALIRDGVWERLLKLGVVRKSGAKGQETEVSMS
jgi:Leucine-rich repeat (LRR) protein